MAQSPDFTTLHVNIPKSKYAELQELAAAEGQTLAAYVRFLLFQHVREKRTVTA